MAYLKIENGAIVFVGSAEADTVFGSDGDDSIEGLSGRDILLGGGGSDFVTGGFGQDTVFDGLDITEQQIEQAFAQAIGQ